MDKNNHLHKYDINCAIFEYLQIKLNIGLIIKNEKDKWNIRLELYR